MMRNFIRMCRPRPPLSESLRTPVRVEELEPRTVPAVFTPAQIRHAYGFDQITFTAQG